MFVNFVISISILIISLNLPIQAIVSTKSEASSHQNVKDEILEWWKKNNESKPLSCKFKVDTLYKKSFLNGIGAPEVKVIPCPENAKKSSRLFFKGGAIKDGYVEGKGKLSYINDEQWKKLSPQKRNEINEQNICLKAENLHSKTYEEIIGNFKNGFLHGKAKISYDKGSFFIASFKNGKLHGYQRFFGPNETLLEAGVYDGAWPTGYHWKMEYDNLILHDKSMVVDDRKASLVFPLTKQGTIGDPMAGDYNPYTGSLDNIQGVLLKGIKSNQTDCVLDIEYQLLEKESFSYSIFSSTKFSLIPDYDALLCNIVKRNESSSPATKLDDWLSATNDILDHVKNGFEIGSIQSHKRAHEILWRLKSLKEDPDRNSSRKLISDINVDEDRKNITARILGSPPLRITWLGGEARLDKENRPHGFNDFQVIEDHKHMIPKANSLGWAPRRINGFFHHGVLNGITGIATNRSNLVWATVKDGILHGPTVTFGINFIMEEVRIKNVNKPIT